ncbi:SDR family NAD(P)-dependent oxidoreductase [Schinkia azotoformans]|uniref:SDR family NAD(P)-dependent oxidoreductase n=1 Tax=Schinkia azotoformans TaxID=1454 RepID=UPI002DBA6554|nr:SDR family NAD(P)-dependent oxidoreductase [Schinkia azotoformans]MEC1722163.1 SDR family NAD(P)-dependent oxidoreductase [Schinkia azotoformans]MED4351382.1 SDR family NAD(P)-dependent oxidoreductase [Schinkia azotoformans]MED4412475.1 SDR family NAD(P)-dependent oxidoreductase [Schinkia azotoformans]
MKKVLVLGASGGMGYSIVKELAQRGINVVAFARGKEKLQKLFQDNARVTINSGDVFDLESLKEASAGVDTIFQAMSIPYSEWEQDLHIVMKNILETAKHANAKLVLVDNIYAYGKNPGHLVTEDTPKKPHTKKGNIRLQLETMVKQSNLPFLIAHFPDFYGPNATNTILNYTLEGVIKNKKTLFVGDKKISREYIFTPDGAKALVELAFLDSAYGQHWNIPGSGVITGDEIVDILCEHTGYSKKVGTVSKGMVKFLGLFDKNMREVVEMFYLTEDPVVLDGGKLERAIKSIPKTPYQDGVKQTIDYMLRSLT